MKLIAFILSLTAFAAHAQGVGGGLWGRGSGTSSSSSSSTSGTSLTLNPGPLDIGYGGVRTDGGYVSTAPSGDSAFTMGQGAKSCWRGAGVGCWTTDSNATANYTHAIVVAGAFGVVATAGPMQFETNLFSGNDKIIGTSTAPTLTGFGSSPTITPNGSFAFLINVGTGGSASTGTITFAAASTGWVCDCRDVTNNASFVTDQTGGSTTTCTLQNYSRTTGLAIAWTSADVLRCTAFGY